MERMFGSGSKKKKKEKRKALEVRARSKSLRALRLRLAWNALAISTGIVLVLLVVWKGGEELLRRYVYTSPSFALENLEIITDARGFTATQLEIALSKALSLLSTIGSSGGVSSMR